MKKIYIILITISLIAITVFFHQRKENLENTEMERFAQVIADESDEDFENATLKIIDEIKIVNLPSEDSLNHYLEKNYFKNAEIFKNYDIVSSVCDSNTYFYYNDASFSCIEYFKELMSINKTKAISNELFNIDEPTPNIYYIAKVDLKDSQTLFIEFYKEKNVVTKLKNYSFGIFNNDILHYKVGNYLYPNNFNNFISQDAGLYKGKKFKHFILNDLDGNKSIIVSIESERWMRYVAPFSFIFFALLLAYFLYVYFEKDRSTLFKKSFHSKMQLTIFLTLTISFVAIGIVSFVFLKNNITKKTQVEQYKQANIIRNKLESNMLSENSLNNTEYLQYLEETFFCDINIYNLEGKLINSTIENTHVLSDSINKEAYAAIFNEDAGYHVQDEVINEEKCTSYYFPILDETNSLAAILNVIYFDSRSEYDDNLSDFALNYINIIIVLLGISSIIVLLITQRTLKPLKIIEEQMGKVRLDGHNEPINFRGRDEIGALVEQYNKMCRQLEDSANKLARNERENAWRGMARQVAHEIKNPLTPMRLNIEYLQMLWDRKDPKFEENLKETLNSLLEQIETLSKIATAFSDYAKLPENKPTTFDLAELLKSTIKLYDVEKNIVISLNYNENDDWSTFSDKNNLGRVFGNIIKNAIQSIGNKDNGHIELTINRLGERYKIDIADNGCGIKDKDKAKIFFPNFTTKSSGMGVGLSVSQDIIQGMGGNITFSSEEGKGTIFTIDIPILKEK
jgi:signal transduction histidine kinase